MVPGTGEDMRRDSLMTAFCCFRNPDVVSHMYHIVAYRGTSVTYQVRQVSDLLVLEETTGVARDGSQFRLQSLELLGMAQQIVCAHAHSVRGCMCSGEGEAVRLIFNGLVRKRGATVLGSEQKVDDGISAVFGLVDAHFVFLGTLLNPASDILPVSLVLWQR
jgi:hypothetical protein